MNQNNQSESDPTTLESSFIQSLAARPCSALDYLYGQCLHVAAIRDNEMRRLQERENIDDILATEEILAEEAATLFEAVLLNHPQAGHLRADDARRQASLQPLDSESASGPAVRPE